MPARTSSPDPDRVQLPTIEHVKGKAADKMLDHAWPVLAWLLMLPVGKILHGNWAGFWWLTALAGVLVTALSVKISHTRGWVTKILTPTTVACAFTWLTAADMAGVSHGLLGVWFVVGGSIAAGWSLHTHHHATQSGVALTLEQATVRAGFRGIRVLSMILHPRKTSGQLRLPGGKVSVDDLNKGLKYVEGAAGLPPGSITITDDLDNAGRANYTLTDPRVLKAGRDWPGPSRPGKSIGEPTRPGFWQDGEDTDYRIVGHHVQEMGMTGAGKSTGPGWNEIAEVITRFDHAEFGVDVTKGRQFLGVFEPALHGLVTDPDQIAEFFTDVHACVKDRANYLADRGHTKWVPGCGLTHLGFQLEEVPDVVKLFGDDGDDLFEAWLSDIKAFRSAGGRWKLSLQRSDFTQLPTIVRGQMGKWCCGVESDSDADFGLSEYQKNKGCQPELWTTTYPGMAYLDAPTIPEKYKAMPMRCFYFGEDTGPGSLIARHAAAFPAAARPLDPVTAKHLGKWMPAAARAYLGKVPVMPGCPGTPDPSGPGGGQPAPAREVIQISTHPGYKPEPGTTQEAPAMTSSIWEDEEPGTVNGDAAHAAELERDLTITVDGITLDYDPDSDAGQFRGDEDEPEPPVLTAEQVQDAFDTRIGLLLDQMGTFGIGDIIPLAGEIGRSRPTLYRLLDLAVTARQLRETEKDGLKAWTRPRRPAHAGVSAGTDS